MNNNKKSENDKDLISNEINELKKKIDENIDEFPNETKEKVNEIIDETKNIVNNFEEKIDFDDVINVSKTFKEKYLNVLADMENLRKRTEQEREDFFKFRSSSFILDLLPTLDMFEMAISNKNVSNDVKQWLIGFEMIFKNFKSVLKKEGVKEINVKPGDEFDGNIHHALEEIESDKFQSGKILIIKQKGYMLHDRLLRPASVSIVKKTKEN